MAAQGLAVVSETPASVVLMFERLAANKDVDVAKLERLIAMPEHILAHEARAAFNRAFAVMQAEIPTITHTTEADGGKWSYAPLEDIQAAVRPILVKHGFGLSFRTERPDKSTIKVRRHPDAPRRARARERVLGRRRHQRQQERDSSAGLRGQLRPPLHDEDLLNITTRGADDDGPPRRRRPRRGPCSIRPATWRGWTACGRPRSAARPPSNRRGKPPATS